MTSYDDIRYPGRPYPQTHPQRLAAVASLFGMAPAPVPRCRVLEIACGDGANLIPMAWALPDSRFVGFDLARLPIESGQRFAARLGLTNLSLEALDLCAFPREAGEFDYIIAHGLYSWVPDEVRDALMALLARHLAPQGVALVSYNAYPGCYIRRMVWEMLRFHTDHLEDPQQRASEAHALLRLLADGQAHPNDFGTMLRAEAERVLKREPNYLLHDDLSAINQPVYFHEFLQHAQQHGLQYLGEAELGAMSTAGIKQQARAVLEALDPLTREQYLDFVRGRQFRQTLLCRGEVALDRSPGPERLRGLLLGAGASARLSSQGGAEEQVLAALIEALEVQRPRRLTAQEAEDAVRQRIGDLLAGRAPDYLARLLLLAVRAGAVELHADAPALAIRPGVRPLASPVARAQIPKGGPVTALDHESVKLDDEVAAALLALLDGTRDRPQLIEALGERLGPVSERAAVLEAHLQHLAKLALLVT